MSELRSQHTLFALLAGVVIAGVAFLDIMSGAEAARDKRRPSAPPKLWVPTRTATAVQLRWLPARDNVGVSSYRIYRNGRRVRSIKAGPARARRKTSVKRAIIRGLTPQKTYRVGVAAVDAAGNLSRKTLIRTRTRRDRRAPTSPRGLAVSTVGETSIRLRWKPSRDNHRVRGYRLYRGTAYVGTTRATAHSFARLSCGSRYSLAVQGYDPKGNRSPKATLAAATSACSTPVPPGTQPTLQAVDGGVNYYSQFANGLPAAPFPIGVWLACAPEAASVQADKAAGLNVYVGLCANAPELAIARNGGMRVFPQPEWLTRGVTFGAETSGWMNSDELDMTQGPSGCATVQQRNSTFPADGRLRHANYGKGVAFWQSDAQAACFTNAVHLPSIDVYWFTDPFACGSSEGGGKTWVVKSNNCKVAANYGGVVNRVRSLISPVGSKPMWNFVELGWPFTETAGQGARTIQPAEVRAAVWHSLIAGARGIIYFNHSFGGSCITQNILRSTCGNHPVIRAMVISVNAQIQSIAAALNGPSLASGFTANPNVRATAKWDGRNFYVLAGSAVEGGPLQGSFAIPCVGNATATVLGENRGVPVAGGAWSDTFADGNAVHIYRVDGGSRCGL